METLIIDSHEPTSRLNLRILESPEQQAPLHSETALPDPSVFILPTDGTE